MVNSKQIVATDEPCDGRECSIEMKLAPLATTVFRIKQEMPVEKKTAKKTTKKTVKDTKEA
jgi:hypothetical protein